MNESQIKAALISRIERSKCAATSVIIQELFVENFSRRADVVVANGILSAFEIKSERDSLSRLLGQVSVYCKYFEETTVVCAEKHLEVVSRVVPECVGIWRVCSDGGIDVVKRPVRVGQKTKANWLSFLPVYELRCFLKLNFLPTSGCRDVLVSRAENIGLRQIRSHVLGYLKERDGKIELESKKRLGSRGAATSIVASNEERVRAYLNSVGVVGGAIPRRVD